MITLAAGDSVAKSQKAPAGEAAKDAASESAAAAKSAASNGAKAAKDAASEGVKAASKAGMYVFQRGQWRLRCLLLLSCCRLRLACSLRPDLLQTCSL